MSNIQKFFSFDSFTWSKELSDLLTFLKQNFCHKKPKVAKGHLISKCLMVSSLPPKKRTDKFAFSTQTAFRGAKRR